MTPEELVAHLREIPAANLLLIQLAWELAKEDGSIDQDQARFRMEEIMLAKGEAIAYSQATHLMVEALKQCLNPDL